MAQLALPSGPLTQTGRAVPNTFRVTLAGGATALAPLRRLASARCERCGARARIRVGGDVGSVSCPSRPSGRPASAAPSACGCSSPRRTIRRRASCFAIDTLPLTPAAAEGEGIAVPIAGPTPLVRGGGRGDRGADRWPDAARARPRRRPRAAGTGAS
jgi:hypothetical protein